MAKSFFAKAGPVLKTLLGVGILALMIASGKLDLAQLGRSFTQWRLMVAILLLFGCQIAVMVWRWRLLLRAQEIRLPFRSAWALTMIGLLFNIAIPGAVGGDLIKGYYITRASSGRKTQAAVSILMDRITGLLGLLFLGAVMVLVEISDTLRTPVTRALGALAVLAFLGGLGGLYAALFAGGRIAGWSVLPRMVRNVFSSLHEYHRNPAAVPAALALSIWNQALTLGCFYLALRSTGVAGMPMGVFFLTVPLGLVATAIPLAPAGVGVGQAAFFVLLQAVAPQYTTAGTAAATVMQAMFILLCLTGLCWYIPYKHTYLAESAVPAGV